MCFRSSWQPALLEPPPCWKGSKARRTKHHREATAWGSIPSSGTLSHSLCGFRYGTPSLWASVFPIRQTSSEPNLSTMTVSSLGFQILAQSSKTTSRMEVGKGKR